MKQQLLGIKIIILFSNYKRLNNEKYILVIYT